MRRNNLLQHFNMCEADYDALLASQDGGCAICGASEGYGGKRLAIDHNHTTGAVRGILCDRCNLALGKFKDDPQIIKNAVEYLEQHR
jgi:hypothetical protein